MRSRSSEASSNSSSSCRVVCGCGLKAKLTTCWRDDNPGRRFYGCPRWPVSFCYFVGYFVEDNCENSFNFWCCTNVIVLQRPDRYKYFEWFDEPICVRGRSIIPGLLSKMNRMEETIEKKRRREKILICIIFLLAMLVIVLVVGGKSRHTKEGKFMLRLEWNNSWADGRL